MIKPRIKRIPGVGAFLASVHARMKNRQPFSSSEYWESRYRNRGTSGAGSQGRLAEFKAHFLNDFVARNKIGTVIEYGCGDGEQLTLATYPHYVGIDVSPAAIEKCRDKFATDSTKTFIELSRAPNDIRGELALSLDVIYHLIEDSVFERYMLRLFNSAQRFAIIYSSNEDKPWPAKHVRHRHFLPWVEYGAPEWHLRERVPNPYPYKETDPEHTSFSDFYVFAKRKPLV
jgi:hypothetical protein